VPIVDANLEVQATRCSAGAETSKIKVFGVDFLAGVIPDIITDPDFTGNCTEAVDTYITAFDRAKKSYRDALELVQQYNDRVAGSGAPFPPDFCESLVADPPKDFPADPCSGESTEGAALFGSTREAAQAAWA
jgi:hypothetical protein